LSEHLTPSNRGFRAFAIGVMGSLALAAVAHLYLFDAAENAAARSMRYDLAWTGANGRIEFGHLEKHIARLAALGSQRDADAARLFYDILQGRMRTWGSGGFRQFIENSSRRLAQFELLQARIDKLRGDIERLSEPASQRHLLEALAELAPSIEQIGAESHATSVAESATIRDALRRHQRLQSWLVLALLASGAIVLAFTARQNRSLRVAHGAAARHAADSLFLARHDPLTKLPNRRAFEAAYHAVLQYKQAGERISIAAIDLDGFKSINDLLGHAAGDAVLIAFSELLKREVTRANPRNAVCRIGGDEFLALLCTSDEPVSSMELVWRILAALERPLDTGYGAIMISASVGIATSESMSADNAIVNADLALTEAKGRGKGIALAFDPAMLAGLKRRLRLEADLGSAIERGDLFPHYQPKVDLVSAGLVGLEALVRWRHPELGWVSPGEFIPVAESSGAIIKLGRLMLEMACRDAMTIPGDVGIAVNLSVVQILKDDIVGAVKKVLTRTGLKPARLTLEITESVMMTDPEKVLDTLNQLKTLGIRISLDDFGTGYSALSYLTQFSWDELKIDRSFIGRAWSDPVNLAIIKAVKMIAKQMNAKLTIEGVENLEQRDLLNEIGCDTAQGYFFSPPVPLSELQPILLRNLVPISAESGVRTHVGINGPRSLASLK
jgi:diguanylate cyclase (GGDEF)-like protein